jgi:DNA polymerase bacteriophage-type
LSQTKHLLVLDIESYYDQEVSLRVLSPPEYVFHPKFEVTLLAAYDLEKWPAPRIIDAADIPGFLAQYPPTETLSISHNALFDGAVLGWRYGWVPARMVDTLGMARALRTLPRYSLGAVAKALFGHDSKGDVIHKVKGLNAQGIKNAGLWPAYRSYSMQDALICAQIFGKLWPEFPAEERLIQDLVLRAAIEPVLHADVGLLQEHLKTIRANKAQLLNACGYDKAALMSTAQFQLALEHLGVEVETKASIANPAKRIPAFAKTDAFMQELLEHEDPQVQTLVAARLSHKSTIEETRTERFMNIAKLPWPSGAPMLPVPLRYGAAHTHRFGGEWSMNLQNLPRDQAKSKLRQALTAPPGHTMIAADLSQIEARLVAVLCGETSLSKTFRAGQDVYATFATHIFRRPVNKDDDPVERFIGKTAILGLGYGCGVTRFYQMVRTSAQQAGIPLDEGWFNERMADNVVQAYRNRFLGITGAWKWLDSAWRSTLNNKLNTQYLAWGPVRLQSGQIILPNQLTLRYEFGDPNIYGAKLLENITQALARIVVMQAALRLYKLGYRWAIQAHDELVFAVPDEEVDEARRVILEEMIRPPAWLPGLPLAAEVKVGVNYGSLKII